MLVGGKWFWCCKDNIIFPLRRHRTARVFPTRRAFSVRPPHSARWAAPNCAFLPYLFTSSAPFFSFLLLFSSPFRNEEANIGNFPLKAPPFFIQSPPIFAHFLPCFAACLARHTHLVPFAAFSSHLRSTTGMKHTSSIYSCTTSSDAGVPFPLPLSQSPVISHHHAPFASSSHLLRFQNSPSTRPFPPHTSVFSDRLIRKFPLSQVINPTFPHLSETHFRDMTQKAHDSHNNSMPFLPFCHSKFYLLSCKIRRTLQKCEEKAWRIGIKALALPKDDRKLGCLNVNNVQSAVRNRQNRLSPDPQA